MTRGIYTAAAFACACFALPIVGHGQSQPATVSASAAIDPDAMAALDRMGVYLRTLKAFQIRATTSRDDVAEDGQTIQRAGTAALLVQRPDRFWAEISSDLQHRTFFYDGTSFTIWARRMNYYATVPAPATVADAIDRVADRYGLELPLVDLFYWGTTRAKTAAIKTAMDVGPSQVDGVSCEHYAFRQHGLDWQVWIQNGEYPLPRKLVLTTTTDEARPQYTSVLTWNLAPAFNDAAFTFTAPKGARKIVLAEVK